MLRVLIHEYFTGGSFTGSPALPPLLSEAYGMLNTLLKDFSYNAGCEVATILDKRLADMIEPLAAHSVTKVSSTRELDEALRATLPQVDAVLIVAPETKGILAEMTETAESEGSASLLGSSSSALRQVSSKDGAVELARSLGIPTPRTLTTTTDECLATIHSLALDIGFPVVIKPQDGAGCEGVFIINNRQELDEAIDKFGHESGKRRLLIQEYVKGTDASVSVLRSESGQAVPLSLNNQRVELRSPEYGNSTYSGGHTPFDHPLRSRAYEFACRIVQTVKGLKGYVGIDFVLTEDSPVFMEINARITTSYAGLSRVILTDGRKGVAPAIIDAITENKLPSNIAFDGLAYYSKFKLKSDLKVDRNMVDVLSNLEYVESPPFPDQEGDKEVFLVSIDRSLNEANNAKSRNERKLEKIAAKLENL